MPVVIDRDLASRFPGLVALQCFIFGVEVVASSSEVEAHKIKVIEAVRRRYDLNSLKDGMTFRAYRDFFWRIGVDPTKTRPAAEALIRRVLANKPLPTINSLVDAYNLASIETEIALAAFDANKVRGTIAMRSARPGEEFLGIGMTKPTVLEGGEIVLFDDEHIVALYPHRDSQHSRITCDTKDAILLACGVPGIDEEKLHHALDVAVSYVLKFCGGALGCGKNAPPDRILNGGL
ncbi:MAG: B3/B4 domain-containing protein [Thermoproteota archaeon]